jgi:hypothetical protein
MLTGRPQFDRQPNGVGISEGSKVCHMRQAALSRTDRVHRMADHIEIVNTELDGADRLMVKFSDGTMAGFVVEELLELRPHREPVEETLQGSISGL